MKWLADRVMNHRARTIFRRLEPHLPRTGTVADIGSGTGHNAEAIRRETALQVRDFDVADLHWVGPGPILFKEAKLPVASGTFDTLLLMFVLQYTTSPAALLGEMHRLLRGSAIVIQSTYRGWWGRIVLTIREFVLGRLAFHWAVLAGVVSATDCPLRPQRYFTRQELRRVFVEAGFELRVVETSEWPGLNVSRDLFVLVPVQYE